MKNQKTRKANCTKTALLLCLIWLGASACSGSVGGTIYLDENNNGLKDIDEIGVPYAKVSVINNGDVIGTGYTDAKGNFSVRSKGSGQYCVDTNLDESAARLGEVGFNVASLKVGPLKTQALGAETAATTTGGTPAATGGTQAATGSTGTTTGATGTQTGQTGTTTHTTDDTEQADPTVPGRICKASKQGSLGTIEFEIPVTLDYSKELANVMATEIICGSGDICKVTFPVPAGCKPKSVYLPQWINLAADFQAGIVWRADLNMVVFDEAPAVAKSVTAQKSTDLSIGVSELGSRTLLLRVNSEVPIGTSEKFVLTPKYDCPTGEVTGPQRTVTATNNPRLAVYLKNLDPIDRIMENEKLEGKKLEVTVENKGKSAVAGAELTVDMPMGVTVKGITNAADGTNASDCRSLNENVQCTIPELAPEAKVTYKIEIDIVWTRGETEGRKIDAIASIARDEPPAVESKAAPIEFTVEVLPDPPAAPANP